jgi:branched-chain amino acid transport system permease protein
MLTDDDREPVEGTAEVMPEAGTTRHVLTRNEIVAAGALFVALVLAGLYSGSAYTLHLLILGCIFGILLMTQNLVIGYMGLLHLGHAAFFALGAYGSALFVMELEMPVFLGYVFGMFLAGVGGIVVGFLSIRFGGHYLAIVSLGFGIIVFQVINNWVSLTRGPHGLTGIPTPPEIGPLRWTPLTHLTMVALVMVLVLLFLLALRRSKLGLYMNAVRADVIAAQSLGINTTRVKVTGYTLAALFAGLAGGLYAHYRRIIAPELFTFLESATIMAMTVLGGLRSYGGSIAGAFFLIVVPEVLREFAQWRLIVYGALLVVVVLYFPRGLAGLAEVTWRGVKSASASIRGQLRGPR